MSATDTLPGNSATLPYKQDVGGSSPSLPTSLPENAENHNQLDSDALERTATSVVDNLSWRSRAYNALYAIGDASPDTVRTLTDAETDSIIHAAQQAAMGARTTELHRKLAQLSPTMLRWIAIGLMAGAK